MKKGAEVEDEQSSEEISDEEEESGDNQNPDDLLLKGWKSNTVKSKGPFLEPQ